MLGQVKAESEELKQQEEARILRRLLRMGVRLATRGSAGPAGIVQWPDVFENLSIRMQMLTGGVSEGVGADQVREMCENYCLAGKVREGLLKGEMWDRAGDGRG